MAFSTSFSGLVRITLRWVGQGPERSLDVIAIKGDPIDVGWVETSISTYGIGPLLGIGEESIPQPPTSDWFVACGRMFCEHSKVVGQDWDFGFSVEGYEVVAPPTGIES